MHHRSEGTIGLLEQLSVLSNAKSFALTELNNQSLHQLQSQHERHRQSQTKKIEQQTQKFVLTALVAPNDETLPKTPPPSLAEIRSLRQLTSARAKLCQEQASKAAAALKNKMETPHLIGDRSRLLTSNLAGNHTLARSFRSFLQSANQHVPLCTLEDATDMASLESFLGTLAQTLIAFPGEWLCLHDAVNGDGKRQDLQDLLNLRNIVRDTLRELKRACSARCRASETVIRMCLAFVRQMLPVCEFERCWFAHQSNPNPTSNPNTESDNDKDNDDVRPMPLAAYVVAMCLFLYDYLSFNDNMLCDNKIRIDLMSEFLSLPLHTLLFIPSPMNTPSVACEALGLCMAFFMNHMAFCARAGRSPESSRSEFLLLGAMSDLCHSSNMMRKVSDTVAMHILREVSLLPASTAAEGLASAMMLLAGALWHPWSSTCPGGEVHCALSRTAHFVRSSISGEDSMRGIGIVALGNMLQQVRRIARQVHFNPNHNLNLIIDPTFDLGLNLDLRSSIMLTCSETQKLVHIPALARAIRDGLFASVSTHNKTPTPLPVFIEQARNAVYVLVAYWRDLAPELNADGDDKETQREPAIRKPTMDSLLRSAYAIATGDGAFQARIAGKMVERFADALAAPARDVYKRVRAVRTVLALVLMEPGAREGKLSAVSALLQRSSSCDSERANICRCAACGSGSRGGLLKICTRCRGAHYCCSDCYSSHRHDDVCRGPEGAGV
jgi:hypothetical protein